MRHPVPAALLALTLAALARGAAPPAVAHYALDPAKSSLEFTFLQAGARNKGSFRRFNVSLDFTPADPGTGRLEVRVEVGSLDTGDQDRDDTLRGADLFDVAKYPQARFSATHIARTANGYAAGGSLTIRGVTRATTVPFTFREATERGAAVAYMAGSTVVRRLDFGVGQGDWQATDQAGNEVTVSFALRLACAQLSDAAGQCRAGRAHGARGACGCRRR
ncbi:MAG TPA: YceI family protein, partial [Steroidobacteraceae bacterium]|nr:YceI family protein [Steroidobacteraceae bacterium]